MPFYAPTYLAGEGSRLRATHLSLGTHPHTHDELMIAEQDRYAGMYLVGVQGVGKSGFLETLIHQDAEAGKAIVVIDPHGDLVNHCLAELPQHRMAQTFVLDMEDEAFPFGINLFATGKLESDIARSQVVERIMHIFEVLWEDVLSQQHLPRFVRAATITFLDNPGSTLVDMLLFFQDDAFRARMVANVKDPTVRQFWAAQFDQQSAAERTRRIQPLVNRLEALFMGRTLVRNIVGQRRTSINFRQAIEQQHILLVKLPVKMVAQDARLVGTILIAQLSAAIFSFADMPEAQRPGLSLYVDEFQHFATADFSELFTEGRKFGVRVTVAHQYRNQLPRFLQDSTMTARTKVVFQTTPEDASEMAHFFPIRDEAIKPDDLDPHPTKYLLDYGVDNSTVRAFIDIYLRPLQSYRRGGKVDIAGAHWDVDVGQVLLWGARAGVGKREFYVSDPTPYLDHLLYEVMRTKNPLLPIPWDAIVGLSNCGGGFFGAVRFAKGSPDLMGNVTFPAYLANQTDRGYVWLRKPETERERFYHCIFHLRVLMLYLAEHPLGKTSKSSTSDAAQILVHLPKRAAFVQCGEDIGVIYTHKTPARLDGQSLAARRLFVREQTRQAYCHPREQFEQHVVSESTTDPNTFSRWEDVEEGTEGKEVSEGVEANEP